MRSTRYVYIRPRSPKVQDMYICPRSCKVQNMYILGHVKYEISTYVLGHAEYVQDMFRRLLHNCSRGSIGPEDYVDTSPTDDLP